MSAYNVYLQGDHWKKFREETIKERKKCEHCGTEDNLIVHHKSYLNLGNEKPEDVLVLCDDCHKNIHMKSNSGKSRFNTFGFKNYFKYITDNIEMFIDSEVYLLTILSKYIDWDNGQLLNKRRKAIHYDDLLELTGYGKTKLDKANRLLKEKGILISSRKGYSINPEIYIGKHKKMAPKPDKEIFDEIERLKTEYPHMVGD